MNDETLRPCRKCGAPNRNDNIYCRRCGAVLAVGTAEVRAQKRPVSPKRGMRWRYVLLGVFVMPGILCFLAFAALLIARFLGVGGGLGGMVSNIVRIGLLSAALFFVAFGLGGGVLTWIARQRIPREVALSAVLVFVVLGVVGSLITSDLLIVAGGLFLPSLISAVLGGRLVKVADYE